MKHFLVPVLTLSECFNIVSLLLHLGFVTNCEILIILLGAVTIAFVGINNKASAQLIMVIGSR